MEPTKNIETPGVHAATAASAAMIAQQVAGKAARDALFLSNFSVSTLPLMMAASAVLSLVAVLWLSRMITRHSPANVVPILFAASAVAFFAEWVLHFQSAPLAAVSLYCHTAVLGPALISSFWSLMNERFDPHTARRAVARVAGGGTLGGVLGSVAVWRAALFVTLPTMLLFLAAANVVCVWGTYLLRTPRGSVAKAKEPGPNAAGRPESAPLPSAFRVLRDAPYLMNLSLLVALGAVTSSLLDYVFSAQVVAHVAKGPALLSFFALFWLVIGILSFALQALLGRFALEKLGIAVTVAVLPGIVVLGGAFGLAVPGLWSSAILRGGEAVQRNSLFRSAYELLYTPLPEEKKRATKTIIDVGFDRLGTFIGSGIAFVVVRSLPTRASLILLVIGIAIASLTIFRSRPLHKGYVGALKESLKIGSAALPNIVAQPRRTKISRALAETVEAIDPEMVIETLGDGTKGAAVKVPVGSALPQASPALFEAIADLQSGHQVRARRVLSQYASLESPLVHFTILLLAHKVLYVDAIETLRVAAPHVTGQLIDRLLSPTSDFVIRRRIPRILARCTTQRAADGLMLGLGDERFEVRYECGRALARITETTPGLQIPFDRVLDAVLREVALSTEVWESQPPPEFDEEDEQTPALIDRLLRDRADRSLEHVFTILALQLEREPLRLAFKALHQEDESLRGTALEYLENVLPEKIRDAVWPFLGGDRPMRAARPAQEILADLLRADPGLPRAPSNRS